MKWLRDHGDDLCAFIALAAAALQGDQAIPANILHWIVDLGLLAAIGHKVFWPASQATGAANANPTSFPQEPGNLPRPFSLPQPPVTGKDDIR